MKALFLSAACFALAGCAGSAVVPADQSVQAASSEPSATTAVSPAAEPSVANVSLDNVKVVDLGIAWTEEEVVCRREAAFGSRIVRQRCYHAGHAAEVALEQEVLRAELAYARELALREEERRMAEREAEAARREAMRDAMMRR